MDDKHLANVYSSPGPGPWTSPSRSPCEALSCVPNPLVRRPFGPLLHRTCPVQAVRVAAAVGTERVKHDDFATLRRHAQALGATTKSRFHGLETDEGHGQFEDGDVEKGKKLQFEHLSDAGTHSWVSF